MGLFDIVRDKAAELFSGASEKVSEVTGVELPGTENAENLTDTATATGEQLTDTATGAAEDLTGTATDAATGAAEDFTGTASDTIGDVTNPQHPE